LPFHYPPLAIGAFVAAGVFLGAAVIANPAFFWPLLAGTVVITGAMFVLGFPIFDEWLTGWLALGGLIAVVKGGVPRRSEDSRRGWLLLFVILCLYLGAEGFRGLVLYHNLKAIRAIVDASIGLTIALLLAKYAFPRITGANVTRLIALSGASYLVLYLVHG